jgi:hypothetical protein
MMCLGWDNNPVCRPPDVVQIVAPDTSLTATAAGLGVPLSSSGGVASAACPDITWFYIGAALVAGGALLKGFAK